MTCLNNIPIIDINEKNIQSEWENLLLAINDCSFLSLDLEMSGLGNRKHLSSQSIEERYKRVCESASNYSILSLGISCFFIRKSSINFDESNIACQKSVSIENKTFNIFTLCSDSFMIEPEAAKFLIEHGFDFNKHLVEGVSYSKEERQKKNNEERNFLGDLIDEISKAEKPLVFHNGFIDLVYLYQHFYAKCPNNLMQFVADLSELFKAGIYDTKYIADFHLHSSASFLEYLFKLAHHENTLNLDKSNKIYVHMNVIDSANNVHRLNDFKIDLSTCLNLFSLSKNQLEESACKTYSIYGYCANVKTCKKSHQTDEIIKIEMIKNLKKKKNFDLGSLQIDTHSSEHHIIEGSCLVENDLSINETHSSGLDAFMTGYVMLQFINKYSSFQYQSSPNHSTNRISLNEFENMSSFKFNVYLTGKDYPLLVKKSQFSKTSLTHQEKRLKMTTS